MLFFTFYIFSLLLSYTDCKRFIVPNIIIGTMFLMVLFFGIIEQKIYLSNLIVALLVLLLFMGLFLYNRNITVGGGDIKYLLVTAFYLKFTLFPVFLIITGLLQTAAILYTQNVRKRRFVPMLPIMFSSVIITDILIVLGIIK